VGWWVSPCKTENQALRVRYWSVVEATSGGHGSGVLDWGEVVVAMLGGVDCNIEWGGGFCPAKLKTECAALSS
jgi:hypothetical protein